MTDVENNVGRLTEAKPPLFTIVIRPRRRNRDRCHHVLIMKQREGEKAETQFNCILKIDGLKLLVLSGSKLLVPNELWTEADWTRVAKSMFIFFTKTNHAVTRKWTDVWHLTTSKGEDEYKMYDCSLRFIEGNVRIHNPVIV